MRMVARDGADLLSSSPGVVPLGPFHLTVGRCQEPFAGKVTHFYQVIYTANTL